MLNVGADRMDYRELLSAPPGYKVSFAVGTTYSLDLETLIATCAIIGFNVEGDTELIKSPPHLLEAIRRASGKLLIFCQSGQTKVPDKPHNLLPLLENCVSEISLTNKRSFHPKVWLIKYRATRMPEKYRLVVMSRNLTFDHSWDVALRLDSAGKSEATIKSGKSSGKALQIFFQWLSTHTSKHNDQLRSKRRQLARLADEVAVINWRDIGKEFDSFEFIPYGIGNPSSDNLFDNFHKLFIISPFLSKSIIEKFVQKCLINPDCTLITRQSELSKLNEKLLTAFDTYIVKDNIVCGEESISESVESKLQDIHAKVYLRTKGTDSDLYIGSANASHHAFFGGNVECLVVLHGKRRYLSVEKLKQDLFGSDEKENPFERVKPNDYEAINDNAVLTMLENVVRDFCTVKKSAIVSGDERYTVTVTINTFHTDVKITLSPLMKLNYQSISTNITFHNLNLLELSEWYIISAKSKNKEISCVIKIPTTGIPEKRDSAIFSNVIKDKNDFLMYIAFLLSDDYLTAFLESMKNSKDYFRFFNMSLDTPILYERMLKAAASSTDTLREVRDIISLTSDTIVPKDFLKLYEHFEKVMKQ